MNGLTLRNKQTLPLLGYGTWELPTGTTADLVETAIKAGYRHIDCAMIYGNEKEVGEGIRRTIDQGVVKREDLFVTSKLWNTDHAQVDVGVACRKTLNDLGLDYLDLYLIHWGVAFEHGDNLEPLDDDGVAKFSFISMKETWQAMEELVEQGLVKSMGVANFTAPMLLDLLSYAKIKPAVHQIELHPYLAQNDLVAFCYSQNIAVTAYSPFGSTEAPVLTDPTVKEVAKGLGKTPAQVLLRWAVQRNTSVIPRSSNATRIKENFEIATFELSNEHMAALNTLNRNKRFVNPIEWWGFPYF
ncbi:Aldehyde reductase [candidate division TM7 genomosp. GTL1]|nr:Aldehyde reductase [candidate division TM7 genomosp. GTL1]